MLDMTVTQATKGFFDKEAVIAVIGRKRAAALTRAGGAVKVTAQRSMKPARRKKVDELKGSEKEHYEIRLRDWKKAKKKGEAGEKPKLPYASSKPGEPPRTILKFMRTFLYFVWDPRTESVVIGPAKLNGRSGKAPGVLEHGGSTVVGKRRKKSVLVKARPFMQPALKKNKAKIAAIWKNAIK